MLIKKQQHTHNSGVQHTQIDRKVPGQAFECLPVLSWFNCFWLEGVVASLSVRVAACSILLKRIGENKKVVEMAKGNVEILIPF